LDGYDRDVVAELVLREWLDVSEDAVWVHDWDDWQLAATHSSRRAYEAARKRDWRRSKSGTPSSPRTPSPTGHDRYTTEQGSVDMSGTRPGRQEGHAGRTNGDAFSEGGGGAYCVDCGGRSDGVTGLVIKYVDGQYGVYHTKCGPEGSPT
jgi:hypothetical protein